MYTYLVLLLVFNNLTPLMGRYRLTASLAQYLLQGVPLVMGLTGLGPCAALNQLLMHLFLWYSPETDVRYKSAYLVVVLNDPQMQKRLE